MKLENTVSEVEETGGRRGSYELLYQTAIVINVLTALIFIIGGCYRYKVL